jgi:hypothetical protein
MRIMSHGAWHGVTMFQMSKEDVEEWKSQAPQKKQQ